ncbi:hypothetical protein [Haloarcula laminariae]|uniref:hypothetical protein n=1 Tax=Haloarcula laminariae TaxID=2961577 RepID=UPI0021C69649|nr:hypothetical protein [Halomicroarcula laminariae]
MKQGSADDPFADEEPDDEPEETATEDQTDSTDTDAGLSSTDSTLSTESTGSSQNRSLPYIHSRSGVKDGRNQRPVFLRDHIEDGIDDLVAQMETEFGENVYKTDVTEAAMAIAEENPELIREKLDEWGYGWS